MKRSDVVKVIADELKLCHILMHLADTVVVSIAINILAALENRGLSLPETIMKERVDFPPDG